MKIECLPVGYLRANCYVVSDEETKKAAVIDPGGNPEKILGYLEENGLSCEAILLTHAHDDHTKGVYGVMEPTGARVYMNRGDVGLTVRRTGLCFQEPEDTIFIGEGGSYLRPGAVIFNKDGVPAGTAINVYDLSGKKTGSAKASSETTNIATTLRSGEVGILKIGDNSIKYLVH